MVSGWLVIRRHVKFLQETGKVFYAYPEVPGGQPESGDLPGAYPT
jgi:hypothetical protein